MAVAAYKDLMKSGLMDSPDEGSVPATHGQVR